MINISLCPPPVSISPKRSLHVPSWPAVLPSPAHVQCGLQTLCQARAIKHLWASCTDYSMRCNQLGESQTSPGKAPSHLLESNRNICKTVLGARASWALTVLVPNSPSLVCIQLSRWLWQVSRDAGAQHVMITRPSWQE